MSATTTEVLNGLLVDGVPTMGMSGVPITTGRVFFVDYLNGSDAYPGSSGQPMKTIYRAYAACTSGKNDTIVVVNNGLTTSSQRLSVANAAAVDSTATVGTLVLNKDATHIIGMGAMSPNSRARFAPPTGTYTQATFGSGNFVTMSASGSIIANVSFFNGFSTGGNNQICFTVTGGRNYFHNVQFGGAGDAASAQSTSSRSLKISGTGENRFVGCQIGLDTVTKTVANASLELASATPRNEFIDCHFPFYTSSANTIGIVGSAAGCIDRTTLFKGCLFDNAAQSGSTTMSGLSTLAASAGGLLMMKDCTLIGITEFGTDATTRGQIYVDGAAPTAATSGIGVNPT
jgi:hypothetical protein